ncbi:hypothetical protein AAVH_12523 [Aphelenchoides avenae]|nr:hypothetical protein AAVH_12523 [Aphelenchus avenae]
MAHRPNGNYGRYPPPPYPPPDVAYPEPDVSPYYRPPQMWPHPAYPPYPRPPPGYGYEGGPPHGFHGAPPQHWRHSRRGNTAGRPKPPTPLKVPGPGETIKTPPLANSATPTAPDRRPSSLGSADDASQSGRANESFARRASGGPGNAQENAAEPPVAVQASPNSAPTPPSPVDVHAQSYAGLKRENDSLQAQLDAMKANMNELKETWDVARNLLASEKNRFKSQSGDAQKEIAELKAKIKTFEAQSGVAALRKQVEDLSEKCLELEVHNKGLLDHLASLEEPQPEEEANRKELREVAAQTEKKEEKDYSMQTPASQLATVETQTDSNVPSETPEVPTPEPLSDAKKHSEVPTPEPLSDAKKHSEVTTPEPPTAANKPTEVPTSEPPTATKKHSEVPTHEPLITPKKPSEVPSPEPHIAAKKHSKATTPEPPTAANKPSEIPTSEPPTAANNPSKAPADSTAKKKPSRGQKRAPATNAHADGVTHLGHHYHYGNQRGRRGKDPCVFWDCDREGCPARAYTSRETGEVVRTMGKHNHPPPSATETASGGKAESCATWTGFQRGG